MTKKTIIKSNQAASTVTLKKELACIQRLPYIQTMRMSLPHLNWIARKSSLAREILEFICHHSMANINNLMIKQSTIAERININENTVSSAIKILLDHEMLVKVKGSNCTYFQINIAYICKGGAANDAYYNPNLYDLPDQKGSFATQEFKDYFLTWISLKTETVTREIKS